MIKLNYLTYMYIKSRLHVSLVHCIAREGVQKRMNFRANFSVVCFGPVTLPFFVIYPSDFDALTKANSNYSASNIILEESVQNSFPFLDVQKMRPSLWLKRLLHKSFQPLPRAPPSLTNKMTWFMTL